MGVSLWARNPCRFPLTLRPKVPTPLNNLGKFGPTTATERESLIDNSLVRAHLVDWLRAMGV